MKEPYRLFFPVGLALGWLGVSHWILYALGITTTYSGRAHAALQMQAFEVAFAAGFLLTAIPRRTSSPPPGMGVIAALLAALLVTGFGAEARSPAIANAGYAASLLGLVAFVVPRVRGTIGKRRPPPGFVLVPIGLALGVAGAALTADVFEVPGWVHAMGSGFVQQGVFMCFIAGVGGLILPMMFGRTPPADAPDLRAFVWPASVGLLIAASFAVEHAFARPEAMVFRGGLLLFELLRTAHLHELPKARGLQRRVAWVAAWCVPLGPIFAGLFPAYRVPLLHVTFAGGFSLLTFAIASHVTLGHGGQEAKRDSSAATIWIYAGLFLLAAATRVMADFIGPETYFRHLAYASGAWLLATMVWMGFVSRALFRPAAP